MILLVLLIITISLPIKISKEKPIINTINTIFNNKNGKTKVIDPIGKLEIPKINLTKYLYDQNSSLNNIEENVTILKETISKNENEFRSKMKSNQDPIVILDQDLKTKKQKVLKPLRFQDFYWSEWRDLNSRPLDPQSSALPTALHPDICC